MNKWYQHATWTNILEILNKINMEMDMLIMRYFHYNTFRVKLKD